jgi:methanethiol S-methyltransferase
METSHGTQTMNETRYEISWSKLEVWRVIAFLYSTLCYAVLAATLLYAVGFAGNIGVPKSVDSGLPKPLTRSILVDLGLFSLIIPQLAITPPPTVRRLLANVIPEPIQRPTRILFLSLGMLFLFRHWHPVSSVVWVVESANARTILWTMFALSSITVLAALALLISRSRFFVGPPQESKAQLPRAKRMRRFIALPSVMALVATPRMTAGHLLFSLGTAFFMFFALRLPRSSTFTSPTGFDSETTQSLSQRRNRFSSLF